MEVSVGLYNGKINETHPIINGGSSSKLGTLAEAGLFLVCFLEYNVNGIYLL